MRLGFMDPGRRWDLACGSRRRVAGFKIYSEDKINQIRLSC